MVKVEMKEILLHSVPNGWAKKPIYRDLDLRLIPQKTLSTIIKPIKVPHWQGQDVNSDHTRGELVGKFFINHGSVHFSGE